MISIKAPNRAMTLPIKDITTSLADRVEVDPCRFEREMPTLCFVAEPVRHMCTHYQI